MRRTILLFSLLHSAFFPYFIILPLSSQVYIFQNIYAQLLGLTKKEYLSENLTDIMPSYKPHEQGFDPFDDQQFNMLFEELYEPLCRFCMQMVHDRAIAEDIVQDQFVYFWENRSRIAAMDAKKAYLYKSVKNKSLSYLKSSYAMRTDHIEKDIVNTCISYGSNIDQLEEKELAELLESAVNNLPTKCRTIFSLRRFAEMSNKEIASYLKISVKTVEAQMTIALKKLRDYLEGRWDILIFLLSFLLSYYS